MTDTKPGEPRFSETPAGTTQYIGASDWNRAEIEAMPAPAPAPPRERLFSRKVLIAWALVAIAAYAGVQVAKSAVKASFRQAIESGRLKSTQTKDGMVIETRNGTRVTIRSDRTGGPSVTVDKETPTVTGTTTRTIITPNGRTTITTPTRPTAPTVNPTPTPAPEAPPPLPPEPKKR